MMLLQIKTLSLNNVSTPSESDTHPPVALAGSSYLYLTILSCLDSLNSKKGQKSYCNFLNGIPKKIQKLILKLIIGVYICMCSYIHACYISDGIFLPYCWLEGFTCSEQITLS